MAPLLSGDQLMQPDYKEAAFDPFTRVNTEEIIDLLSAALESIGIGNKKKGKKTTLIRDTAIALLKYLGGEALQLVLHAPLLIRAQVQCKLVQN